MSGSGSTPACPRRTSARRARGNRGVRAGHRRIASRLHPRRTGRAHAGRDRHRQEHCRDPSARHRQRRHRRVPPAERRSRRLHRVGGTRRLFHFHSRERLGARRPEPRHRLRAHGRRARRERQGDGRQPAARSLRRDAGGQRQQRDAAVAAARRPSPLVGIPAARAGRGLARFDGEPGRHVLHPRRRHRVVLDAGRRRGHYFRRQPVAGLLGAARRNRGGRADQDQRVRRRDAARHGGRLEPGAQVGHQRAPRQRHVRLHQQGMDRPQQHGHARIHVADAAGSVDRRTDPPGQAVLLRRLPLSQRQDRHRPSRRSGREHAGALARLRAVRQRNLRAHRHRQDDRAVERAASGVGLLQSRRDALRQQRHLPDRRLSADDAGRPGRGVPHDVGVEQLADEPLRRVVERQGRVDRVRRHGPDVASGVSQRLHFGRAVGRQHAARDAGQHRQRQPLAVPQGDDQRRHHGLQERLDWLARVPGRPLSPADEAARRDHPCEWRLRARGARAARCEQSRGGDDALPSPHLRRGQRPARRRHVRRQRVLHPGRVAADGAADDQRGRAHRSRDAAGRSVRHRAAEQLGDRAALRRELHGDRGSAQFDPRLVHARPRCGEHQRAVGERRRHAGHGRADDRLSRHLRSSISTVCSTPRS